MPSCYFNRRIGTISGNQGKCQTNTIPKANWRAKSGWSQTRADSKDHVFIYPSLVKVGHWSFSIKCEFIIPLPRKETLNFGAETCCVTGQGIFKYDMKILSLKWALTILIQNHSSHNKQTISHDHKHKQNTNYWICWNLLPCC